MTLSPILAVTRLLVREYLPRGGPWILALYTVFLVGTLALPVPDEEARAQLVRGFTFEAASLLAVLAAVFAAALAVPRDVAWRRVQPLFAKPIARAEYVVGRAAGGWVLCAALLASFYVLTVMAVWIHFPAHLMEVDDAAEPSRVVVVRFGGGPSLLAGGITGMSRAWDEPRAQRVWLVGGAWARFEFRDVDVASLQSPLVVRLVPRVYTSLVGKGASRVDVSVGWGPGHTLMERQLEVRDRQPVELVLASDGTVSEVVETLDVTVRLAAGERLAVGFDLEPDAAGRARAGVGLALRPGGFPGNLLRAYLLALVAGIVMVSLAVLGSTRLSAWVSLFFAVFFCLLGSMVPFIEEVAGELLKEPAAAESSSVAGEGQDGDHAGHDHGKGGHDGHVADASGVTWMDRQRGRALGVLSHALPDLSRFDAPWLRRGLRIPWTLVASGGWYALPYVLGFLVLAAVSLQRRELG